MTNEEAIKMFKAIIMAEIDRLPHHYDAEVGEDVYDSTSRVNELLQLNKIVSKALGKQIPKKPINLTCPNCGFDRIDNSWWVFTYCPKCGQLLDWEEEDEQQGSNRDIKEKQADM